MRSKNGRSVGRHSKSVPRRARGHCNDLIFVRAAGVGPSDTDFTAGTDNAPTASSCCYEDPTAVVFAAQLVTWGTNTFLTVGSSPATGWPLEPHVDLAGSGRRLVVREHLPGSSASSTTEGPEQH